MKLLTEQIKENKKEKIQDTYFLINKMRVKTAKQEGLQKSTNKINNNHEVLEMSEKENHGQHSGPSERHLCKRISEDSRV